jgi:hypothetical protein
MHPLKLVYYALLAFCLITLLVRIKKVPAYCFWFVPIIFLGLVHEYLKDYLLDWDNFLTRIYQPLECLLLVLFYNQLLKRKKNKKILFGGYVAYVAIVLSYYSFYRKSFDVGGYFDFALEALLICILVVLFLFELLDYQGDLSLFQFPAFWLNAAHLLFYGGCFFAMSTYEYFQEEPDTRLKTIASHIPYYLNLILYSIYLFIFSTARKEYK